MIGGLMKKTSLIAVLAAAGLFAGGAQAADLGGNCCTDLEERIAELEATAARKGNRNVSLTVYGHVNEMIMFWDDGVESNAYVGTNDDSRSRFGFRGNAKINSEWTAGYIIEVGVRTARSDRWSQTSSGDTVALDLRKSAWYLQSSRLGRVTVGRESTVDSGIFGINLARVNAPVYDDWQDRFRVRNSAGGFLGGVQYDETKALFTASSGFTRQNIVRYDSPTYQGFTFSANWGEDDYWAVALRYANEFNGVRVAAGVSYGWTNDGNTKDQGAGCTEVGPNNAVDCENWGVGASIMHVATGLFVSGSYAEFTDNLRNVAPGVASDDTDRNWLIMAGIERKWNSLGKTTIYGAYYEGENNSGFANNGGALGFDQAGMQMWSIGLNQQVSAAAMDLYLAYFNASADVSNAGVSTATGDDLQAVVTGAKIRF
jgi:predicted porin